MKTASSLLTERWKGPEPYGRGSSTSSPSPPLVQTGAHRSLQCSRVTEPPWAFFVQGWLLCLHTDEPHSSARDQGPAQPAGFWMNMKGGVGKCSPGGVPSQGKVSSSPHKFTSWHLFNHPLIPCSCCELIIVCKSENTKYAYLLKEWNTSPF